MKYRFLIFFFLLVNFSFAQVPVFDKMEQLYDQQHFKMVYRRANRLLNDPTYDYSLVPLYYKSISGLQLARDDAWRKSHATVFDDAIRDFELIRKTVKGRKIIEAHHSELVALKLDLAAWTADLNRRKEKELSYFFSNKIETLFIDIDFNESDGKFEWVAPANIELKERSGIIDYAKNYLGTPYVWAGQSPQGFDCSGFTSYVLLHYGINIPRRAKEQYENSIKLTKDQAQVGDLVFFSNGTEVSHVGILVSEKGQDLVMIHASSSKGITFDKITGSSYWEKRVQGFGTFLNK